MNEERDFPTNRGLLRILCSILCPPCPAKIATKLAFHPPTPTYDFVKNRHGFSMVLNSEASWHLSRPIQEVLQVSFTLSKRKNLIACAYLNFNPASKYTVLVSHPNAVDLGETVAFCIHLSNKTFQCCNFFIYDYSGYGISAGSPSPQNVCDDIQAAFMALCFRHNVSPKNVVLFGQSIGSVPSIDLASKSEVGGLILVAPLSSGISALIPGVSRIWCCDPFPNLSKVKSITCKVLLIHGCKDSVIPITHSKEILKEVKNKVHPLFVKNAEHNDVTCSAEFFDRVYKFLNYDLQNP